MAAFVVTQLDNFHRNLDAGARQHLTDAMAGGSADALKSLNKNVYGQPDFIIQGTTDTNTAAASSPVIKFNGSGNQGVVFDASTYRDIMLVVHAANGSNCWRYTTIQRVLGGTDPTLKGPVHYVTDCEAYYGFTTSDGTTTTEDAASCIAPAWWDGASPVAGNVASNAITIQWLGTNAPVSAVFPKGIQAFDAAAAAGDSRVYQHGNISTTNGTSDIFVSDVATPTAANWPNGSVVRAHARLLPPVLASVLIDTASTPDQVWVGALGLSSDVVTWNIKVYISDPVYLPLV